MELLASAVHVQVHARSDLRARLQVRSLAGHVFRPGRSSSGPGESSSAKIDS